MFILLLISCGNEKNNKTFYKEEQIFAVLKSQGINVKKASGFIFILKSFGCSKCEEVTYSFINKLIEKNENYLDKFMYVISNNDELLLRERLFNDTRQKINYFILNDYDMARYALVFNTDILLEIKMGQIVNFVHVTDENYKEMTNRYIN